MVTDSTEGILSSVRETASASTFCWSVVVRASPLLALTTIVPEAPASDGKYFAATAWAWTDS